MKELTPSQRQAAAEVFESTSASEVLVCPDGTVFVAERHSLAINHCRTMKLSDPLRVSREEVAQPVSQQTEAPEADADEQEQDPEVPDDAGTNGGHEEEGVSETEADQEHNDNASAQAEEEVAHQEEGVSGPDTDPKPKGKGKSGKKSK